MIDDTLVLDATSIKNRKCSICHNSLQEHPDDPLKLQCTRCFREYMPATEVIEADDEMVSVHEDEHVELGGIGANIDPLVVEGQDDEVMTPSYRKNTLNVVLREGEQLIDYNEDVPDS